MTGCKRKAKQNLYMGRSNRGMGAICLIICDRSNHENELREFHARHIKPKARVAS
jgi:hypothetical protein